MKNIVNITDKAKLALNELCYQNQKNILKLYVTKKGCSGSSYQLEFADSILKNKWDEEVLLSDQNKMIIDAHNVFKIIGTKIDFHENEIKKEFVFDNVNKKGMCGCGESFNL